MYFRKRHGKLGPPKRPHLRRAGQELTKQTEMQELRIRTPLALSKGTTPVPTDLIDRVLPTLRDTELRVLLVVVRQTLGWQVGKDPYLRKERDWLTQSQLMRRMGRASGAVARAVDALVRRGLIDVLDQADRSLETPAKRRRCLGRLYYRLHKAESAPGSGQGILPTAKSEYAKSHTTKHNRYKNTESKLSDVDKFVEKPLVTRRHGWVRVADVRGPEAYHPRRFHSSDASTRWKAAGIKPSSRNPGSAPRTHSKLAGDRKIYVTD